MDNEQEIVSPDWFGFDWSLWTHLEPDGAALSDLLTDHAM